MWCPRPVRNVSPRRLFICINDTYSPHPTREVLELFTLSIRLGVLIWTMITLAKTTISTLTRRRFPRFVNGNETRPSRPSGNYSRVGRVVLAVPTVPPQCPTLPSGSRPGIPKLNSSSKPTHLRHRRSLRSSSCQRGLAYTWKLYKPMWLNLQSRSNPMDYDNRHSFYPVP